MFIYLFVLRFKRLIALFAFYCKVNFGLNFELEAAKRLLFLG